MSSISIIYHGDKLLFEIRKEDNGEIQSIYQYTDELLNLSKFLNRIQALFNDDTEYWVRADIYLNTRPTVLYGGYTGDWVLATQKYGEDARIISFTSDEMKILIKTLQECFQLRDKEEYT